jgi:hypothetical protein
MPKNLIIIGGKPRSGKDEFARGTISSGATVAKLSDHLIFKISLLIKVPFKTIEKNKVAWRPMLQWFGEVYFTELAGTTDTGLMGPTINQHRYAEILVVTGCRRKTELMLASKLAKSYGASLTTIWIYNPNSPTDYPSFDHPIENELSADDFQFTVINNSTIQALHNHAKRLVERLHEKRDRQT